MANERAPQAGILVCADISEFVREAPRHAEQYRRDRPDAPATYRLILGRDPIPLGLVEFRLLLFLAGNPYHAFTRQQIATAISTEAYLVTEESVEQHVAALREQLGFFRDYVQSVPYIGYRFKP